MHCCRAQSCSKVQVLHTLRKAFWTSPTLACQIPTTRLGSVCAKIGELVLMRFEDRRQYDFMGVPLIAPGGRYNLCWCGPRAVGLPGGSMYISNWRDLVLRCAGTILVPGKDYRQPDGIIPPPCPPVRDEARRCTVRLRQDLFAPTCSQDGGKFLSPAGHLIVVGPRGQAA